MNSNKIKDDGFNPENNVNLQENSELEGKIHLWLDDVMDDGENFSVRSFSSINDINSSFQHSLNPFPYKTFNNRDELDYKYLSNDFLQKKEHLELVLNIHANPYYRKQGKYNTIPIHQMKNLNHSNNNCLGNLDMKSRNLNKKSNLLFSKNDSFSNSETGNYLSNPNEVGNFHPQFLRNQSPENSLKDKMPSINEIKENIYSVDNLSIKISKLELYEQQKPNHSQEE